MIGAEGMIRLDVRRRICNCREQGRTASQWGLIQINQG
jgi:hypothetical protein